MAIDPYGSDILDKKSTKIIQSIVVTMLYYAWSVGITILWAINKILRVQPKPTRDTEEKSIMLLYYAATYPNSIIRYKSRNMVLHVDSDAAYLNMLESRSFYSGYFYLRDWPLKKLIKPNPKINGPIHIDCKKSVISYPQHQRLKHVETSTTKKQLSACDQP